MNDEMMKEHCRRVLKRIAWRLQYTAKTQIRAEAPILENKLGEDTTSHIVSHVYVQQLLMQIPEKARFIIKSIVIDGLTEEEVARKLNMTRQGVSKCKNKYLSVLAQKMNPSA
ncbi:sigma-70 family RNA polymerase sigma factor [Phocaeicola vulgatus]|nr:sigma-70 family RNA polymerase sigma factor [Phocaeicola vulgatus]MDR7319642.1 DNA-directed RNA polymerase specialized sigma subunit [Brevibacillus nitrificans]